MDVQRIIGRALQFRRRGQLIALKGSRKVYWARIINWVTDTSFRKIYGGLNWNPGLRSPLTEPGINVKAGEYILAVNGKNVTSESNIFSFFENTAGKIVELTIGPRPDTTDQG